jgi:hypothetical protein
MTGMTRVWLSDDVTMKVMSPGREAEAGRIPTTVPKQQDYLLENPDCRG